MLRLGSVCRGSQGKFCSLETFIRTGWLMPLMGIGWNRPLAAESVKQARIQQSQSPWWAGTGSSHPNRFVWLWVEAGPLRVQRESSPVAQSFD